MSSIFERKPYRLERKKGFDLEDGRRNPAKEPLLLKKGGSLCVSDCFLLKGIDAPFGYSGRVLIHQASSVISR